MTRLRMWLVHLRDSMGLETGQPHASSARFFGARERPLVMYVLQHREASGAEASPIPLMHADADPLVACPHGGSTEKLLARHGIPTTPMRFRTLRSSGGALESVRSVGRGLAGALELRRILKAHSQRTIVCCATIRAGLMAAIAAVGLGRRVVWLVSDLLPPPPLRWMVRLVAAVGCAVVVPSSQTIGDDFTGSSPALRRKSHVVYPSVDLESHRRTTPYAAVARAAIVGHISATKQTHLAVETARHVAVAEPAFRLDIAGRAQYREADFEYERNLVALVERDDQLRPIVRFGGQTADVAGLLEECGLLLHCRPDEPFGMVLIEAMAMSLPVVAPRACGPTEIVSHGVTGYLYTPGDVEEAAAYVLRLIRDPALAEKLGAAGRERVARFSVERQVSGFDALLAELAR